MSVEKGKQNSRAIMGEMPELRSRSECGEKWMDSRDMEKIKLINLEDFLDIDVETGQVRLTPMFLVCTTGLQGDATPWDGRGATMCRLLSPVLPEVSFETWR